MEKLISKAEEYVIGYLTKHLGADYVYHNLGHTKRVVDSAKELIELSDLNEHDQACLLTAAWFHDTGFTKTIEGHEEESVKIASKFLETQEIDQNDIDIINGIIMATKVGKAPDTELERLIKDADCGHVASKNYKEYSSLLRKEWELTLNKVMSKRAWLQNNIAFISNHTFYSEVASNHWQEQKGKNLASLLKSKKKAKSKIKKEEMKAKYKVQYKNESPERGVQTFFRTALRNHIKLSDIADTKANILLSVNAIIISVVLANLISKLDTNPYLTYPVVIFTLFSVISMVMSIIATRPNVTSGEFTKEDVRNQNVNLSFFGNFHKMKLEEFEWAIRELVNDKDYIYKALTKDLYFLGKVLERKYRILRITYTVFMIGIIVSLIAFGIAVKNNPGVDIQDVLENDKQTQIIEPMNKRLYV
ncbi:MAG: Pycsar system effector family protein [Psychroserpens sp.]|uniref:Pycsar system effector family protein n=1 Tax=Psychroserpens sp. TaxID=2020870 RepID=UPI003C764D22